LVRPPVLILDLAFFLPFPFPSASSTESELGLLPLLAKLIPVLADLTLHGSKSTV
jgi:hypothetical protein